ncbi:MAG: hypothetical protein EKK57_01050 [Proteobacteria bacterium]|nr:MAG: hypothetical protein EKK57_01050 [Pseudomonadota bacterium]
MAIVVLLILLVVAVVLLLSVVKAKKALNAARNKVQELSAYTAEHIKALELEGVSVADDLEVQKTKAQKLKKSFVTKLVSFAVVVVIIFIVL